MEKVYIPHFDCVYFAKRLTNGREQKIINKTVNLRQLICLSGLYCAWKTDQEAVNMPNAQELWQDFISSAGSSSTRSRAMRQFVGRNELLKLYFELMDRAQEEQFKGYYVVNFYGEPGIGKSTLLRQIENRLQTEAKASQRKPPVILRADFDNPALSSVQDVLGLFRAQLLSQVKGAAFPFFDMAVHLLVQKQGRRLLPDEEKESLMDNPVLSFAMGTVADMVGLGTVLGAFQAVFQVKDSVANLLKNRKEYIRRTYEEIEQMDAPDLIRRLPYYFAMDVNATRDMPMICVFLDTYERAAGQADSVGYNAGFDESWLTGDDGLIANLGNAVFAVAGREPLPCKEEDNWHIIRVNADSGESERYQRRLDVLSDTESMTLLTGCGMNDELAGAVYRLTGGDPVFLELCLDQYDHLIADEEDATPDKFGTDTARLVERHTRYLPAHLWEPLFLLASMGRWTDAQYDKLREATGLLYYPISDSTDYRRLTGLSYVWPEGDGWAMRDKVAEVLSKRLTSGIRRILINKLIPLAEAEREAFHPREAEVWYALAVNLEKDYRDLLSYGEYHTLLDNWADVCDELFHTFRDEKNQKRYAAACRRARELKLECCQEEAKNKLTPELCRAQYEMGEACEREGCYDEALPWLRKACLGYLELKGPKAPHTVLAAGALHYCCEKLGKEDTDPRTMDIPWDYEWTGNETAEDLPILQSWVVLWLNAPDSGGTYDKSIPIMQRIVNAYHALEDGAGHKRVFSDALAAEITIARHYVDRQEDVYLMLESTMYSDQIDGKEWDWNIPMFRNPEAGAEVVTTCMELVERVRRALPPTDPQIADALDILATAQELKCLYHLAIPVRYEAMNLLRTAYGFESRDAALQEEKLIADYQKAGKPDEAICLQKTRLERVRRACLQKARLEHTREAEEKTPLRRELSRTADLYRHLLAAADGDGQIRECFTALNDLLEELRALPGKVFEHEIVPWGRAAIWCLNHAEQDVEPDTEQFVSAIVDCCKDIFRFDGGTRRTAAQVILEGMEEESGWRYDLWEDYQPDEGV